MLIGYTLMVLSVKVEALQDSVQLLNIFHLCASFLCDLTTPDNQVYLFIFWSNAIIINTIVTNLRITHNYAFRPFVLALIYIIF